MSYIQWWGQMNPTNPTRVDPISYQLYPKSGSNPVQLYCKVVNVWLDPKFCDQPEPIQPGLSQKIGSALGRTTWIFQQFPN